MMHNADYEGNNNIKEGYQFNSGIYELLISFSSCFASTSSRRGNGMPNLAPQQKEDLPIQREKLACFTYNRATGGQLDETQAATILP
jgi:hypothetical protein